MKNIRVGLALWGACLWGSALAQGSYSFSTDGTEVTDARTGLTWRRCSEGQSWSGAACTGTAAAYTHPQALAHAQSQTGWRLPNVKELASLVDRSRSSPAIDITAFPVTPASWYWTATPYVGSPVYAWSVDFGNASVDGNYRHFSNQVRLVR